MLTAQKSPEKVRLISIQNPIATTETIKTVKHCTSVYAGNHSTMGTTPSSSKKEQTSAAIPSSSKCPQEDDALSQLMSKDPVLGQVLKITMNKLDETNKKLDHFNNELQRNLDTCQDQVNKLAVLVKSLEDDKATRMDKIQQAEKPKDKEQQVVEDCLSLPAILRRILEQFSDKELINLSLVNKCWNYEARSMLRDRGRLLATIPACLKLVQFASDLEKMRVVPFTGIHIDLSHSGNTCESISNGSLNSSLQVILDRLPWKHLSVGFYDHWGEYKDCPALVLVKKILEDYGGVLQELSISNVDREKTDFVRSVIGHRSLACLKTLRIKEELTYDPLTNTFMKAMVSCAPNLDEFHIAGRMEFTENVMEGSSGVLVSTLGLSPLCEQVCEGLCGSLRTDTIDLFCAYNLGFDVTLLNRVVPTLIQTSHKTLTTLRMDVLFAVPLMCYGIWLENVTELCIYVAYPLVKKMKRSLGVVRAFDFTRLLPKLSRVKIAHWEFRNFSLDDISAFIKKGKSVAKKASFDRAINIRHMELSYLEEVTPPLTLFAQVFPHVKTISVQTTAGRKFPFKLVWEYLGCLEELQMDFTDASSSVQPINWDSVFCGIFPEEVAELRAKDDEYLKAVNIVPVMPSIGCMWGLRLFRLRYSSGACNNNRQDPTRIFSKVTALIGFPRCPTLYVELVNGFHSQQALDHMKPYVSVVTEDVR